MGGSLLLQFLTSLLPQQLEWSARGSACRLFERYIERWRARWEGYFPITMAPVTNGRLIFNEIPAGKCTTLAHWLWPLAYVLKLFYYVGYPIPGRTTIYDESQSIDVDTVPLNGSIVIKVLVLSIDPYLRGKMRPAEVKSYSVSGKSL